MQYIAFSPSCPSLREISYSRLRTKRAPEGRLSVSNVMFGEHYSQNLPLPIPREGSLGSMGLNRSMPKFANPKHFTTPSEEISLVGDHCPPHFLRRKKKEEKATPRASTDGDAEPSHFSKALAEPPLCVVVTDKTILQVSLLRIPGVPTSLHCTEQGIWKVAHTVHILEEGTRLEEPWRVRMRNPLVVSARIWNNGKRTHPSPLTWIHPPSYQVKSVLLCGVVPWNRLADVRLPLLGDLSVGWN
ncbi:hypothetical protein NPIL_89981 [Nephila pilipes]|uniref:Uncharacterized protein n=1 Tax=Nephila pilipes TaxID=299642 RepID=A0A8X6N1G4_NEPPI|nr:hypothetical protein NPIL_89981 [Nephila pilipes]